MSLPPPPSNVRDDAMSPMLGGDATGPAKGGPSSNPEMPREGGPDIERGDKPREPCVYLKGGICRVHGKAAKKWKPGFKTVVGKDGKRTTEYKRIVYYVCDLGPEGWGRLRQSKLSFDLKTTPGDNPSQEDTNL